jgi:hypothetical protein
MRALKDLMYSVSGLIVMPYLKSYKEVDGMSDVEIVEINKLLDEINEDRTVPRNVRLLVVEAKKHLNNEKEDMAVRINSAVSILDEVSNDPNIPTYTRTQIWNIVSLLEIMHNRKK